MHQKEGKGVLSIAAQLRTSCHVVVGLPYEESASPMATAKESGSPDSHSLCIFCLGTKRTQAALSNPRAVLTA